MVTHPFPTSELRRRNPTFFPFYRVIEPGDCSFHPIDSSAVFWRRGLGHRVLEPAGLPFLPNFLGPGLPAGGTPSLSSFGFSYNSPRAPFFFVHFFQKDLEI